MKVLIACEFSGIVRDAFAARGHDAWSCDLLPTERPGNHIQGDVRSVLQEGWDMAICFPPCTYLTNAGVRYWKDVERQRLQDEAFGLFMRLYNAPIAKVAVENPRGYVDKTFRRPDQYVNPFDFGEAERKRICLWLRNLPPLMSTLLVNVEPKGSCIKANGRKYNYYYHQGKAGHARSRFFPAVALAMAEQWG